MGHALGLRETFEQDKGIDPQSLDPRTPADRWDLVYSPGISGIRPQVFFDSREDLEAYPEKLGAFSRGTSFLLIDGRGRGGRNCRVDSKTSVLTCDLKDCDVTGRRCVEGTYSTGDPALKGLAFDPYYGGDVKGTNLMSYDFLAGQRRFISDSQVQLIRKYLRWAIPANVPLAYTSLRKSPFSANLPLLGSASPRQIEQQMDVDGDGLRDIGVWIPPSKAGAKGLFKVLLSSRWYSDEPGKFLSVELGGPGDIPVVADFTGDGRADVGVFQPGGGYDRDDPTHTPAIWRWCPTNAADATKTTCTSPVVQFFGKRGDVPMPGLCFSSPCTPHLAVFRPTTGEWVWREVLEGSSIRTVILGGPQSVPLPALYDEDEMTDLAVYEQNTGEVKLLRSTTDWKNPIVRSFGKDFVPKVEYTDLGFPTGKLKFPDDFKYIRVVRDTGPDRSGAIALPGMTRPMTVEGPDGKSFDVPRRVFSLYYPEAGSWHTMWDPIHSGEVTVCQTGFGALEIPVPGFDVNGDMYSDVLVVRAPSGTEGVWFNLRRTSQAPDHACSSNEEVWGYDGWNWGRARVYSVADMSGDGSPDLLFFDPDEMVFVFKRSDGGFGEVLQDMRISLAQGALL